MTRRRFMVSFYRTTKISAVNQSFIDIPGTIMMFRVFFLYAFFLSISRVFGNTKAAFSLLNMLLLLCGLRNLLAAK